MAAHDALDGQVAAFDRAVFSDGFYRILAAGRGIAAVSAEMRRYKQLVPTYENDK
jgi:hypothetical protein